jgi:acid phosphatase (class A)
MAVSITLLLLTACAVETERAGDDRETYVIPSTVNITRLLSPPPTDIARDLAVLRSAQETRTPEQVALAESYIAVDVFLFRSVLGPRFTREPLPRTAEFFSRMYRSALPYLTLAKECWKRSRPFVVDPTLTPLEKSLASTRARHKPQGQTSAPISPDSPCAPPGGEAPYSYSYPSGHAAVGAMMAILLAEMVPERRAELFACGWEYGEARVISGVHYPSDVEAGRILGTLLVGLMQGDARFQAEFRAARAELRDALGYP